MSEPRFHVPPQELARDLIRLTGPEAGHAAARRLKKGERVSLFDGQGGEARAVAARLTKGEVVLEVTDRPEPLPGPPTRIALGLGLVRWERLRLAVEKATELGAAEVAPILSEFAQKAQAHRAAAKLDRVVIEALKQCRRSQGPRLVPPATLEATIERYQSWPNKIILSYAGEPLPNLLADLERRADTAILVGPEGGFSDGEVRTALMGGFEPASLSPAVLRTETAAITAVAMIQAAWGS